MSIKMCNFAPVMEKILRVYRVNDYARYIGAPELHPLVSVIHYDETLRPPISAVSSCNVPNSS